MGKKHKKRKHHKVMADDRKAKIRALPYLSKKIADDLIYMYEREEEWAKEVHELIEKVLKHMDTWNMREGLVITGIDLFNPVKYEDVCVDYDYAEIIDSINSQKVYTNLIAAQGEPVVDITYIRCKMRDRTSDRHVEAHYIEYKTGAHDSELKHYWDVCLK